MPDRDALSKLMEEAGEALGLLQVKRFEDRGLWTLLVDEDVLLYVELDEGRGCAVLSGEVAEMPEGASARLAQLLVWNGQWQRTGGQRLGLDAPGGSAILMVDLPLSALTLQTLSGALEAFTESLRTWREIVSRPEPTAAEAPPADDLAHMIRV